MVRGGVCRMIELLTEPRRETIIALPSWRVEDNGVFWSNPFDIAAIAKMDSDCDGLFGSGIFQCSCRQKNWFEDTVRQTPNVQKTIWGLWFFDGEEGSVHWGIRIHTIISWYVIWNNSIHVLKIETRLCSYVRLVIIPSKKTIVERQISLIFEKQKTKRFYFRFQISRNGNWKWIVVHFWSNRRSYQQFDRHTTNDEC